MSIVRPHYCLLLLLCDHLTTIVLPVMLPYRKDFIPNEIKIELSKKRKINTKTNKKVKNWTFLYLLWGNMNYRLVLNILLYVHITWDLVSWGPFTPFSQVSVNRGRGPLWPLVPGEGVPHGFWFQVPSLIACSFWEGVPDGLWSRSFPGDGGVPLSKTRQDRGSLPLPSQDKIHRGWYASSGHAGLSLNLLHILIHPSVNIVW